MPGKHGHHGIVVLARGQQAQGLGRGVGQDQILAEAERTR